MSSRIAWYSSGAYRSPRHEFSPNLTLGNRSRASSATLGLWKPSTIVQSGSPSMSPFVTGSGGNHRGDEVAALLAVREVDGVERLAAHPVSVVRDRMDVELHFLTSSFLNSCETRWRD